MTVTQKQTKIIATLGPASQMTLMQMFQNGVNVIRLNASHYKDSDQIRKDVDLIREASDRCDFYWHFLDLQALKYA